MSKLSDLTQKKLPGWAVFLFLVVFVGVIFFLMGVGDILWPVQDDYDWHGTSDRESLLVPVVFTVFISAILFLIIREFVCWYWKQNAVVNLLKEINEKLDRLPKEPQEKIDSPETKEEPLEGSRNWI